MQEGASAGGADVKTCPMCAEDIPLDAEACEYCGAGFDVARTGYCPECHSVGTVTPEAACARCGAAAIDVRVESRHLEGATASSPPPPPPPPPPPAPQQCAPVPAPVPVAPPQPQYAPPQPYPAPPGYPQTYQQQPYPPQYAQPYGAPPPGQTTWTYQPGMGGLSVVPPEARGWNWGAFFLSWIWGIGNNTWISLLTLIPYVNLVMVFVLGAKGSEWAWRNKRWESVEQFKRTQRTWAIVGLVLFAIGVVLGIIGAVAASMNPSTTTTGMTI